MEHGVLEWVGFLVLVLAMLALDLMALTDVIELHAAVSLAVVLAILVVGVAASILRGRRRTPARAPEAAEV